MNVFRVIASVFLFSISSYLVYDLFANGFNWMVLIVCLAGYFIVHYIWPKKKTGDSDWYDILEMIVDLPYRTLALLLRSIGKIVRGSDGDIGIDL